MKEEGGRDDIALQFYVLNFLASLSSDPYYFSVKLV